MKFSPSTDGSALTKGRDGWSAESWMIIGGDRYLKITTRKTSSGLRSTAYGVTVTESGYMMELFSDFREDMGYSGERCTEKTIAKLHLSSQEKAAAVLERAITFYAVKDAMKAIAGLSLDLNARADESEAVAA